MERHLDHQHLLAHIFAQFLAHGNLLGIVSTHFANVHEPTPIEMNTLKAYAVIAAEYA